MHRSIGLFTAFLVLHLVLAASLVWEQRGRERERVSELRRIEALIQAANLAQQTLERAIALDASLVKAHYQLGLTYARLGDQLAATRELELAAQLEREQKQQQRTTLRLLESPPKQ